MNDLWQAAMDMESRGRELYLKLAGQASLGEIKGVFSMLADEELRHYRLFESLRAGAKVLPPVGADVIAKTVEAFQRMAEAFSPPDTVTDAETAYRQALVLEESSVEHYTALVKQVTDKEQVAAVQAVLAEEKRHERVVKGLIEFVRRPKEWIENAEFFHLEEY